MAGTSSLPRGRRLLPTVVDEDAITDPGRVWASFPRTLDVREGFRDITTSDLANSVNKMSWIIENNIGRGQGFETMLYMGIPDIRHFVVLLAGMKTGYKTLYSSHRNSLAGHVSLLEKTDCKILLHSTAMDVSVILKERPMRVLVIPETDELFDQDVSPIYPFNHTWEDICDNPVMIVHTSGSTGLPKPVTWLHKSFSAMDLNIPPLDGCLSNAERMARSLRFYSLLPVFHGAALANNIVETVFHGRTLLMGPSIQGLVSPGTISQMLDYAEFGSMDCIPYILEQIAKIPEVLNKLRKLDHVVCVGGQLSKSTGDLITTKTHLINIMASTETSIILGYETDPEDWQYLCLNAEVNGIKWEDVGNDLYELTLERRTRFESYQTVFFHFPDLAAYSMGDIYRKHPKKPHHWYYEGRKDDMIINALGWNFNPIMHEQRLVTHPSVKHAILVGTKQYNPAAIIELYDYSFYPDDQARDDLLDELWPKVDEANRIADSTGRLERKRVIFAVKEKPFLVTGKGTVQRADTIKLYKEEIDSLYSRVGD